MGSNVAVMLMLALLLSKHPVEEAAHQEATQSSG